MNIDKLETLLQKDEGPKLDFKAILKLNTNSEKKEFTKDVVAIANSKGGRGYIVFGIEDKSKRVIGINPADYREEKIQQIICRRINPPLSISVDVVDYKKKKIAILSIFKSFQVPHQMMQTGAFYVRRGSTTDFASREEVASMLQYSGMYCYESTILSHASVNEFDIRVLDMYFKSLGLDSSAPSDMILESLGFIGYDDHSDKYKPTIGGIMFFGKNPEKYLPHVYIKVYSEGKPKYFYGNIPTLISNVEEYLKSMLGEDYQYEALFQTIDNAVVHRDYTDVSRGIIIVVNEKSITISNPGAMLPGNLMYMIEREKDPRKRNPWLYQRLMILSGSTRFYQEGIGIRKVKKQIKDVKFVNMGSQNLFKVILPR